MKTFTTNLLSDDLDNNFSVIADGTEMHYNAEWTDFTPSWTSSGTAPAIVDGTLAGRYIQIGSTVWFRLWMIAGAGTTFGTGNYFFSLPVNNSTVDYDGEHTFIGQGLILDVSASTTYLIHTRVDITSQNKARPVGITTNPATYGGTTTITNAIPVTLASGDGIALMGKYEVEL